jgi:hypothetical protein
MRNEERGRGRGNKELKLTTEILKNSMTEKIR